MSGAWSGVRRALAWRRPAPREEPATEAAIIVAHDTEPSIASDPELAEMRDPQPPEAPPLRPSVTYDLQPAPSIQIGQVSLRLQYQALARSRAGLPTFSEVEFKCYSQNGEDGILLYLFSLLGTTNQRVIEVCAGHGLECNATNLIVNHGWDGLLLDGDDALLALGRAFYAGCRTTSLWPPVLAQAWITAENVNAVVSEHGYAGAVDLLSLDVDGNDYWIWRALDCIAPRVVVLEFNAGIGPEDSVTMSYAADFQLDYGVQPYRCGASLAAFVKLGRAKGYRLVGVQSMGFNAFFVRDGIGEDILPEVTPSECFARTLRLQRWSPATRDLLLSGERWWEEV